MKEEREAILVSKMQNLKIGEEDLQLVASCKLKVEERLIQIIGHFYKYDPYLDKNILVKKDVFMCVDRVLDEEDQIKYMIHVVDMSGKFSYCRAYISSDRSI